MLQRCIFGMQEQVRLQISALIFPSTYISQLPGGSSGDGLAFFLSPNGSQVPEHAGGGYLGLITNSSNLNQSENPIVAVEFDTFKNGWDPSDNHVPLKFQIQQKIVKFSFI
ncbi:hypothetical protein LWI28_013667 [Acer negundo]|uniref:Legume lectin domain-containing protein n=1 Tax=Acer negundo TaxID=4023 RepID=A0AAD5JKI7_ACENE|nr:hypothetical protein LWI28_013667 [Acer negundo]